MVNKIVTKRCTGCKLIKPMSKFQKRPERPCGYHNQCKECRKKYYQGGKRNAYQRHYRQTKQGKTTIRKYEQSEKGKVANRRKHKEYRSRFPERQKARTAICNAIRLGKLRPPTDFKCTYCPKRAQQYHHPSYKPEHWFDVEPVCKKCHKKIPLTTN